MTAPATGGGLLGVRSVADFRAIAYTAVPLVSAALVAGGIYNDAVAPLWIALALAILNPVVQFKNTDSVRKWFYVVLGAANSLAVVVGIVDPGLLELWLPIIQLVVGYAPGAIASQNVVTTSDYDLAA